MKKLTATIGIVLLIVIVADTRNVIGDSPLDPIGVVSSVPPPAGLISWWPGDGDANDMWDGNNGQLLNGTTFADGKIGQAFSFDGIDDYVEVPDSPSLNIGTGDFSIDAWIRTDYMGLQTIVDKRVFSAIGVEFGYCFFVGLAGLGFQMADGVSYRNYDSYVFVQDGKFHHVAVTVRRNSSDGGKLFVDGAVVMVFDPTPYTGNLDNTANFRIGGHLLAYPSGGFLGLIDEMKFFNRALTDEEVLAIYNATKYGDHQICDINRSADYFPISPGTTWRYLVNGKRTETSTVLSEKVKVGQIETSVFYYSPSGEKEFYTSDSNGVLLHRVFRPNFYIAGLGYVSLSLTFIPPVVLADGSMVFGQSFESSGIVRTNNLPWVGVIEFPYDASFTFEGCDNVTVPAGNFDVGVLSGTVTTEVESEYRSVYLAEELGIVKMNSTVKNETMTWELISTNAGYISLITPNGGEVIPSGSTYNINWESSSNIVSFKLMYSLDNGMTWIPIPGADNLTTNNFSWTVPSPIGNKKTCRIKVIGYNALKTKIEEDKSDKPFTIEVVRVIQPNGAEPLKSGDTYPTAWVINGTKNQVTAVKLYYSMDGGINWVLIKTLDPSARSYNWPVPTPTSNKKSCYVKVVAYSSNIIVGSDISDKPFTIEGVKVVHPNGGETLKSGDTYTIEWEINGTKFPVTAVKLYYSMDGMSSWSLIDTLESSSRSYNWQIPVLTGNKNLCYIRVVAYSASKINVGEDKSDRSFTIEAEKVSLPTIPSGPGFGICGISFDYSTGSSISSFGHEVEYQFDWKGNGTDLSPWSSATQSKIWTISGSYNIRGRARCSTHTSIVSAWSNPLKVTMASIHLIKPNGGEILPSGSTYPIQWESSFTAAKFKVSYSVDNGTTWIPIPGADNVTGSSHNWTVPTPTSNKSSCSVKVVGYSASNANVGSDTSDKPFTIRVVELTFPNGGEEIKSGDTVNIKWTAYQTSQPVRKVQLFYTKEGATNWIPITSLADTTYPPGEYTQPWTVPPVTTSGTKCKVKVVLEGASGNNLGSDFSDAYFIISNPTIGTDPIPPDWMFSGFGSSEVYRGQTFRLPSEHAVRAIKLRLFVGPTSDSGANFHVLLTEMDMTGGFHPTTVIFESTTLNVPIFPLRRGPDEFVVDLGGLVLQPGRDYAWILDHFVVGNKGAYVSMGTGIGSYSDGRAFSFPNGPVFPAGTRKDHFASNNWFVRQDLDFAFQLEFTILP